MKCKLIVLNIIKGWWGKISMVVRLSNLIVSGMSKVRIYVSFGLNCVKSNVRKGS